MATARYYVADKNPEGASIFGVPLADIDESEWETYPAHVQRSVDASDMYRKTNPSPEPRRAAKKEEEG